jgi:hypothetical protein
MPNIVLLQAMAQHIAEECNEYRRNQLAHDINENFRDAVEFVEATMMLCAESKTKVLLAMWSWLPDLTSENVMEVFFFPRRYHL